MGSAAKPAPVIVVGAGPAGLAAGACLKQRGITPLILEAGDAPGYTWIRLYDRLHLHTVKALSGLPGFPMPRDFPRYPSRAQVVEYLTAYSQHFGLTIETNCPVTSAAPEADGWRVTTPRGDYSAQALVSATGVFSQPMSATYPDQALFSGHVLHASAYKNAAPFAGQRVLIVGAGNTGAEIALDLAEHGVTPTIAIRAGANVVPLNLLGVPIQRWAHVINALPHSVTSLVAPVLLRRSAQRQERAGVPRPAYSVLERPGIPIIGLDLLHYAQQGTVRVAGAIQRFTPTGVRFANGDQADFNSIILATGYRPALGYLADAVPLDEAGRPALDGVRAANVPHLYFVGMNYGLLGTLFNISREAPLVADLIAKELSASGPADQAALASHEHRKA
ncbi:MAG TPA: NAD(P)/FAD-dependent oxidoreductase [Ktedonobacterales bacterium]|nr:NAD(P)/FAD-dependent oxidoreductase [Ktedonobacterales bacterium]